MSNVLPDRSNLSKRGSEERLWPNNILPIVDRSLDDLSLERLFHSGTNDEQKASLNSKNKKWTAAVKKQVQNIFSSHHYYSIILYTTIRSCSSTWLFALISVFMCRSILVIQLDQKCNAAFEAIFIIYYFNNKHLRGPL